MTDLISRAEAIEAVVSWTVEDRPTEEMPTDLVGRIKALPSADAVSRKDIIGYIDRVTHSGLGRNKALEYIRKYVERTESADTVIVHTEKEENENSNKEKV